MNSEIQYLDIVEMLLYGQYSPKIVAIVFSIFKVVFRDYGWCL
jgi:hypothetical protein